MYSITHECLQIRCSNFLSLLTLFSEFYLLNLVDIAQFKIKIIVHARNQRKNRAEIRSWLLQNLCSLNTRRGSLAELAAPVSNKSSPCGVLLSAWIQRSWSKPHTLHWFLEAFFNLRNSTNSHTPFSQFNNRLSLHRALDFWQRSENNPLFTLLHSPECDLTCKYVVSALQEKNYLHIGTTWQVVLNIQDAES